MDSRWKIAIAVLEYLVVAACILYFINYRSGSAKPEEPVVCREPFAHIVHATANVQLKSMSAPAWKHAHDGLPLYLNDILKTGAQDSANVQLVDGAYANVGPDRVVVIDSNLTRLARKLAPPEGGVAKQMDSPAQQWQTSGRRPAVEVSERGSSHRAASAPKSPARFFLPRRQIAKSRVAHARRAERVIASKFKPEPENAEPIPANGSVTGLEELDRTLNSDGAGAQRVDTSKLSVLSPGDLSSQPIKLRIPALASYIDLKSNPGDLRVAWEADPVAIAKGGAYLLELSQDPTFSTVLVQVRTRESSVSNRELHIHSGTYFWRVSVTDGVGSTFRRSETWTFTCGKTQ